MEGAKVMKEKEQEVLKSALKMSLENQTKLQEELGSLLESQMKTYASLTESVRLQISFETLWVNLTSESHLLDSCAALWDSASSQQMAADSQRKACESETTYLVKQVENRKVNA